MSPEQLATELTTVQLIVKFMADGGYFMWLILGTWIWGVALGVERLRYLLSADTDAPSLMSEVKKNVIDNRVDQAINICNKSGSILATILKGGLKRANQTRQQIQDIIEASIIEASGRVEKRLAFIALLANVSTLLGLLGTIQGLILSFTAVTSADASEKARMLMEGISKAMNTTALGLVSAITLLFIHSYLSSKATKILKDMDENSMRLVDILGTKKNAEYEKEDEAA